MTMVREAQTFGARCGVCHAKRRPTGPARLMICVRCDLTPSTAEFHGRVPTVPEEWSADGHRGP